MRHWAKGLAEQSGEREESAHYESVAAVREALFRNAVEAKQGATQGRHLRFEKVATLSTAPPSYWLLRGILPCLKPSLPCVSADSITA